MPGVYTIREEPGADLKQYDPAGLERNHDSPAVDLTDPTDPYYGDNPLDPETRAIVVLSRQEFVWSDSEELYEVDGIPDAMIMPPQLDSNPGFSPDEIEAGIEPLHLKKPVLIASTYWGDGTETVESETGPVEIAYPAGSPLQFGNNYIPGAFHGFKYEDLNGDGVYQPPSSPYVIGTPLDDSEPGIANILVGLIDERPATSRSRPMALRRWHTPPLTIPIPMSTRPDTSGSPT